MLRLRGCTLLVHVWGLCRCTLWSLLPCSADLRLSLGLLRLCLLCLLCLRLLCLMRLLCLRLMRMLCLCLLHREELLWVLEILRLTMRHLLLKMSHVDRPPLHCSHLSRAESLCAIRHGYGEAVLLLLLLLLPLDHHSLPHHFLLMRLIWVYPLARHVSMRWIRMVLRRGCKQGNDKSLLRMPYPVSRTKLRQQETNQCAGK